MEQTKQLVISGKDARALYPTATAEWKTALETSFGKEFFSQKPTDRIKTFEDACQVLGIDPGSVWHNADQPDEVAYKKLKVVVRALNFLANDNNIWIPDYNNSREAKWYPWFYLNNPGFRLCDVSYGRTGTYLGSRLVFKTEEIARYAKIHYVFKFWMTRHVLFYKPLKHISILFAGIAGVTRRDYIPRFGSATLNDRDNVIPCSCRTAAIRTLPFKPATKIFSSNLWQWINVSFPAYRVLNSVKTVGFIGFISNTIFLVNCFLTSPSINEVRKVPGLTTSAPCITMLKHFLTNRLAYFLLCCFAAFFTGTCKAIASAFVTYEKLNTNPFFTIETVFKVKSRVMKV